MGDLAYTMCNFLNVYAAGKRFGVQLCMKFIWMQGVVDG